MQSLLFLYQTPETVDMYRFQPNRFSKSSIAAQQESNRVHVVNNGSILWIDMVKLLVYVYKRKIFIKI